MKTNGDKVNMAHAGVGSVSHTTGMLLHSTLNAKPTLVAYRGTGPALNDLMASTVDFMTDQIVNVAPQIQGGNIKAFAIATPERSPALPNVPTTKEAGLPTYEVSAWNAVFAPKGTPAEITQEAQRRARQGARRREHAQAPARARRRDPGSRRSAAPRRCRSSSRARSPAGRPVRQGRRRHGRLGSRVDSWFRTSVAAKR